MDGINITNKTREFDLGNISPQKIYETLVEILVESDTEQKPKLGRLKLENKVILSEDPFVAKMDASHGLTGFSWGELITCRIYTQAQKTILRIKSKGTRSLFDGVEHRKNIYGLYSELNFRLKTEDSPLIDQALRSDEKQSMEFHPITYEGIELDCIITTLRILLCRDKIVFAEINRHDINMMALKKEIEFRAVGYFFIAFFSLLPGLLFLLIPLLLFRFLLNDMASIAIPFISIGITFLIIGLIKQYVDCLQIQVGETSFKLFAQKSTLIQLENSLKGIRPGELPSEGKT